MDQSAEYISKEKRKALEKELLDLEGPKRKEILASLEYAKSLGDLSENAEYHQARADQGGLEERIVKIKEILKSSKIIEHGSGDTVEMGSTVVLQKEGNKDLPAGAGTKTYMIVGSEEADMALGKISNHSPLGVAIYGKKKGENIALKTPSGQVNYKIISVS